MVLVCGCPPPPAAVNHIGQNGVHQGGQSKPCGWCLAALCMHYLGNDSASNMQKPLVCFVMQIQKLSLSVPITKHSYVYMLSSIIAAVSFGLIIYGIPTWTSS